MRIDFALQATVILVLMIIFPTVIESSLHIVLAVFRTHQNSWDGISMWHMLRHHKVVHGALGSSV